MRPRRAHRRAEDLFGWLELVETDGPFLSRPALKAPFPAGLPRPDDSVDVVREAFRSGFTDWERAWTTWMRTDNRTEAVPLDRYLEARDAWVHTMTLDVLEWGEYGRSDDSAVVRASNLDHSVTVSTASVLEAGGTRAAVLLLVDPTEDLAAPGSDGWTASAIDRAAALLRASGEAGGARIPVAVVTDGRWWALVWQSAQGSTGSGVFDGALFREEPDLRDAFWALARLTSLAGGAQDRRLPALLEASVASAEEITYALGNQVRASVELLVQSLSASHLRAVIDGADSPLPANGHEVYDAAVTSMMRIVFLLFAEANELLPPEQLYRDAYAISDVLDRLDDRRRHAVGIQGDEALASTYDTWHRLLATSRALYEGATFEDLRMPAYGGSLFDPARFPWLTAVDERSGGLRVLVDDRVMFHVLRSLQHALVEGEDRQVSFRELDVEQIGYVYEGLLGYSARYTDEVVVGLQGPEAGSEPEIPLEVLHKLNDEADENPAIFADRVMAWVKDRQPGAKTRTARQLAKAYAESGDAAVEDEGRRRLRPVIADEDLVEELVGYYKLMRLDPRGLPYVVPAGGLVVVETRSRATSGTHYTPRSFAEEVVHHALKPLVYSPGPLQTSDTNEWKPISASELLDLKVADIAVGSGAFLVAAARYLADKLLEAWDREGITREDATADQRQRRRVEALREVIAHCLYGADINPMAVEMCKLSLWLISLDPARPFSFVDDKILCGNSLLGLTELRQLRGLHIEPSPARLRNPGFTVDVDLAIQRATELRHQLASPVSEADTMRSTRAKRALLAQLDENNEVLRAVANGVIAAGLAVGGKPGRQLDAEYEALSFALMQAFPDGGRGDQRALEGLLERGLTPTVDTDYERWGPLHWLVEFPDVMVEHGGFDAIIGNPPFLGGKKISGASGANFREFIVNVLAGSRKGEADLVGYFVLRAIRLLRQSGTFGLIASESLSEGEARRVVLDPVLADGIEIVRAQKRRKWPTVASVHVSILWGTWSSVSRNAVRVSDGQVVSGINSSLEPRSRVEGAPAQLAENADLSFMGSILSGQGFVLSVAEYDELTQQDPLSGRVCRPYVSGSDINQSSRPGPSSYVIDFGDMGLAEARRYPAALARVERLVKPARDAVKKKQYRERWWLFAERGRGLYAGLERLDFAIGIVLTSDTIVPIRVSANAIFSNSIGVFLLPDFGSLAILSSSFHQAWAMRWGSSLDAATRYTTSDVFETFPRPVTTERLERVGRALDEERAEMMARRDLGLTKLYGLVNDPAVAEPDAARLRAIQVELDEAVADAYGWPDISLEHGFHAYRQMERFTVSPPARVELLDRLLEENHQRATVQSGGVWSSADAMDQVEDVESGEE